MADKLLESEIRNNLGKNAKNIEINIFDTVSSTNDIAKEKCKTGYSGNCVILSEYQTDGRGRMGRKFYSPEGSGLYMSIALKPRIKAEECVLLTVCAACAVSKAIDFLCGCETKIKWVNDILLDRKKVCGILTEAEIQNGGEINYAVVGIGVNVTGTEFNEDIKDIATSVEKCCGKIISRNHLAGEIINNFFEMYENLQGRNYLRYYREKSAVLGKTVEVISPRGNYFAKATDIDENGNLAVEYNGENRYLNSGEIRIIL